MARSSAHTSIRPVELPDPAAIEAQADEALLRLFWNRAELKKEFARLSAERAALKDRIRQQEGRILRWQQRLEQLEGLLADPAQAVRLALHYQLRALWSYGQRRLARLVRERTRMELSEEQRARLAEFAERKARELAELDSRLDETRAALRDAKQALSAARRRYGGLSGWLRRRHAKRELADGARTVESAVLRLEHLREMREIRAAETLEPESQLSIAGRRRVNLAAIAMAQELVLHFDDAGRSEPLVERARGAFARPFRDLSYGSSTEECRRLSRLAARRLQEFESMDELPVRLERRSRYLAQRADYRREQDTVPLGSGLAEIPARIDAELRPRGYDTITRDVLGGDYWELYSVLVS